MGVPVTTDPAVIAQFLRKQSNSRVVFSTYHSAPQSPQLDGVPEFDLVVAHEAHRVAGPISDDFATVLDAAAMTCQTTVVYDSHPANSQQSNQDCC